MSCADSGILECPCNGRFGGDDIFYANVTTAMGEHGGTKVISNKDMTIPAGECAAVHAAHTDYLTKSWP